MGDIHGAYRAMVQCLERSGFDYQNDRLIQLGDVTDGYTQVYECVEELLQIKHLVALKGNHDDWFTEFIDTDFHPYFWNYGAKGTLISYLQHCGKEGRYFASRSGFKTSLESGDIPENHKNFFRLQKLWHIDDQNRCFVHAGFNRHLPFHKQKEIDYYWNRTLWLEAKAHCANRRNEQVAEFIITTQFKEIYIGHTPTTQWQTDRPLCAFNIWNMDTGAGHPNGKLTIMDIDTKEFWQSDLLRECNK